MPEYDCIDASKTGQNGRKQSEVRYIFLLRNYSAKLQKASGERGTAVAYKTIIDTQSGQMQKREMHIYSLKK